MDTERRRYNTEVHPLYSIFRTRMSKSLYSDHVKTMGK